MPTALPALEAVRVPIDSLQRYPGNARRHDIATIRESLRANGQYRPIVVQAGTRYVLAGHGTLDAALDEGYDEIWVTFYECDEATARRIVLVDNKSNDAAWYDEVALAALLEDAAAEDPALIGTGFTDADLRELLDSAPDREGEDTEPGPRPAKPKSKLGDVYVLGAHRLVCGDSTKPETVAQALDGAAADLVYTDPPYGMSYESSTLGGIEGDDLRGSELLALVQTALRVAADHRAPGAAAYVWCTWRTFAEFRAAVAAAGLKASACIVWRKGSIGPGSADYRPEHEFCLYCKPDGDSDHALCIYCSGDEWNGGRGESDVWEVPRDSGAYLHPTQKPTALAERALKNSTRAGSLVLDVFAGSGSTLIAAENLNRRAALVELDPAYCDVIVDRWERHTGRKAERKRRPRRG